MYLFNIIYTVNSRVVVSLIYGKDAQDVLEQLIKSHPGQTVELSALMLMGKRS